MAKPRKPKNEGAGADHGAASTKPESFGAIVRHQRLCLSIDLDKHLIYGYTELEIVVPEIGIVGLYAENLGIESVLVDGEPAEYEYYPRQQIVGNDGQWGSELTPSSAADAACSAYVSALEREVVPNLLINCCKVLGAPTEQQGQVILDNGVQSPVEAKENVKMVHINYWVEKTETGIHFDNGVLHTDSQIRRARCWFPCMDEGFQCCCYHLEFTVALNLIAISTGSLLYQVVSKDVPPRKTYVYKLDVPVAARWIALVVAPFEILADPHLGRISYMCLPDSWSKLQNTVECFHNAFNLYEEYLDARFPFGSYTLVFLPPEMAVSPSSLGASLCMFSSQVLYDQRLIDQAMESNIKLAFALAKQWFGVYIIPEESNDEWLLQGLAGFLTDLFIRKFLGNNEARYRRYKANCAVCKADDSGATALSSSTSCKDLFGINSIGTVGKIRSGKSVAVLQMLEKQMGPEAFRKILQKVVSRAQDPVPTRVLSTKEFRHLITKIGNLERPFLKEFFPRWVCSCGCPVLRMGFSYNKRKNQVELAVQRECTAPSDASACFLNADSEIRDGDLGWPGMMSIRVHELDGMYDHPVLPLAGDAWQLLEIQCHSKLAARRIQKTKKGSKPDGLDENGGDMHASDMRSSVESPLSWIRADPEMEYLAEIQFNQPVQMWINQLEKDEDVVAQAQAITALAALSQISFSVVNALNNLLSDSKAYWRIRIEAAYALAKTATKETDWSGLVHLLKFYKSRRYDTTIGLPKPNDFHDFAEYFVLEAIPHAVATVKAADSKSPREAVEFILQLLKFNDNTGNPHSDVVWLAALVLAAGELDFGQQSIVFLPSLLKHIDRLLQFDRLMPSHNGIITVSCIRTLTQIALKLSGSIHLDRISEIIKPFRRLKNIWQVRIEASRALLDLELHCRGIDESLLLFIKYLEEEPSLRGQLKLSTHALHLSQTWDTSESNGVIQSTTLVSLLRLLEGNIGFNNVSLRHQLFCILQVIAGRSPTLYGVPRNKILHIGDSQTCSEQKTTFPILDTEMKATEPVLETQIIAADNFVVLEASKETAAMSDNHQHDMHLENPEVNPVSHGEVNMDLSIPQCIKEAHTTSGNHEEKLKTKDVDTASANSEGDKMDSAIQETVKGADTVVAHSQGDKKPIFRIKVKTSTANSKRVEDTDNRTTDRSQGRRHEPDRGGSSSVSVDAPQRLSTGALSANLEEVNSCMDRGSHMTASIGSAKPASDLENMRKELQCTADSSRVEIIASSPRVVSKNNSSSYNGVGSAQKFASLQTLSAGRVDLDGGGSSASQLGHKEKGHKKDKKRRRDDPEYLERKRLKKEKKQMKKEMVKLLSDEAKMSSQGKKEEPIIVTERQKPLLLSSSGHEPHNKKVETKPTPSQPSSSSAPPKIRIKLNNRMLNAS